MDRDMTFFVKGLDGCCNKLGAIIQEDSVRYTEPGNDVLSDEALHIARSSLDQGGSFDPLCEQVYGSEQVFKSSRILRHFANNVTATD